jgi:hypothetical protein
LGLGAPAGQVLFWDGSTLMDGKKRHHQAMGGGMDMGLQILKFQISNPKSQISNFKFQIS